MATFGKVTQPFKANAKLSFNLENVCLKGIAFLDRSCMPLDVVRLCMQRLTMVWFMVISMAKCWITLLSRRKRSESKNMSRLTTDRLKWLSYF